MKDLQKDLKMIISTNISETEKDEWIEKLVNGYIDQQKALIIDDVVLPKGTLPLDKLLRGIDDYINEQENHPIKRTPEKMTTILAVTYWCKKIAENLTT